MYIPGRRSLLVHYALPFHFPNVVESMCCENSSGSAMGLGDTRQNRVGGCTGKQHYAYLIVVHFG